MHGVAGVHFQKAGLTFSFLQTMVTVAALSWQMWCWRKAMHKCILKPLKGHVEAMLKHFHVADGSWKQLKENLQLVSAEESPGARRLAPP